MDNKRTGSNLAYWLECSSDKYKRTQNAEVIDTNARWLKPSYQANKTTRDDGKINKYNNKCPQKEDRNKNIQKIQLSCNAVHDETTKKAGSHSKRMEISVPNNL